MFGKDMKVTFKFMIGVFNLAQVIESDSSSPLIYLNAGDSVNLTTQDNKIKRYSITSVMRVFWDEMPSAYTPEGRLPCMVVLIYLEREAEQHEASNDA